MAYFFRKIWLELKSYIFKSTRISIWEFQSLWMLSVRRQVYSKNPIQADISQDSATTKSEIDDFNASDDTGMHVVWFSETILVHNLIELTNKHFYIAFIPGVFKRKILIMDDGDEVTDQITNNLAVNFTEPGAILKKGIKFQNEKEFDEYMSTDSLITAIVTTSMSNSSKVKQHFDQKKNSENEKLSEYEKIRLRNIAERKKMFQELNLNQLKKNVAILPIQ